MSIATTSANCTKCASAWDPCAFAQFGRKCLLAPLPRGAHSAHSSGRWHTSPRTQTSARLASSWRGMNSRPAAHAAKLSNSISCAKTLRAAGCATNVRRKPGITDALPAQNTKQPRHSTTRGKNSKRLSTPAARPARRARLASVTSPTIGPWPLTDASARHARLCPTAGNVGYATKHWRNENLLRLNGTGQHGPRTPTTGVGGAPRATPAQAAIGANARRTLPKPRRSAGSVAGRGYAQCAACK